MGEKIDELLGELRRQIDTGLVSTDELEAFLSVQKKMNTKTLRLTVQVDYHKSIEEMLDLGRYSWCDIAVTSQNFPSAESGSAFVDFELICFNTVVRSNTVINYLKGHGLRAATIRELLALGAAKPLLQLEFPIIALGSVWESTGRFPAVPLLGQRRSEREIDLHWFESEWDEDTRFLAASR